MVSITNAMTAHCSEIPEGGLRQDMHRPHKPLDMSTFFDSPNVSGDDGVSQAIDTALIFAVIKKLHPAAIKTVFPHGTEPVMPAIDCLKPEKTGYRQFDAIYHNEGTIEGNYGVQKSIFQEQLKIHEDGSSIEAPSAKEFSDRLFLIHGDQMTAKLIRTVKAESLTSSRPYDRRRWLLGVSAWFHTSMAIANTAVQKFWSSGTATQSRHTIESDVQQLNKKQVTKGNIKFHLVEPVLTQGFAARVAALFYEALRRRSQQRDRLARVQRPSSDSVLPATQRVSTDLEQSSQQSVGLSDPSYSSWNVTQRAR